MIHEIFKNVIDWYMLHINYASITILMTIESSFIPFPSEIVIPPAAFKAAQGHLNFYLVVLFGTLGSIFGALINYFLAYFLGRKVIYRLADTKIMHLMLINRESIEKAESYFLKHGNMSTFIGRLLPAIRQLISLPAGLARMPMRPFLFYTTAGALIWNAILGALGFFLYSQRDKLDMVYQNITYVCIGVGLCFIGYLVVRARLKSKKNVTIHTP